MSFSNLFFETDNCSNENLICSSYREVHEPPPPYPGGGATARKKLGQPEISTSRNDPDFEIRQRLDKLKEKEPEGVIWFLFKL